MRLWTARVVAAVTAGLLAYALIVLYAWLNHRTLIYHHDSKPIAPDEAGLGGLFEARSLTAEDGTPLTVWMTPGQLRRPVVLYFMGEAGSLADRAARLKSFAAEGYGVAALVYRGSDGAPGSPSEEALAADARTLYDNLEELFETRPTSWRVALYGESLGAAIAARLGADRPAGAVILESPFTSMKDLGRANFDFLPAGLLRDDYPVIEAVRELRAPSLVLYGGRDEAVPPEQSRAVYEAAPDPKRVFYAPEAAHGALWSFGAYDAAVGFIEYFARLR